MRELSTIEGQWDDERTRAFFHGMGTDAAGVFRLHYKGRDLKVIATADGGWDHVSVSLSDRTPTWAEMEYVKRLFFNPDEVAMQLHVPVDEHRNCHPYCLHLWRPHDHDIPMPPADMVAPAWAR